MKTITTGILGAGRIGRLHGDNILRMNGVDLKAVADPYADFGSWPEAAVATGEDPDLVLGDDSIEAVLICSPTPTHADFIERAAAAGKHIFCEKPIGNDIKEIRNTLKNYQGVERRFQIIKKKKCILIDDFAHHPTAIEKTIKLAKETFRKGKIIAIVTKGDKDVKKLADYIIEVPETEEMLVPLLATIPLQLLSYHIAVMRDCNVDQPRNLAKSVTVE